MFVYMLQGEACMKKVSVIFLIVQKFGSISKLFESITAYLQEKIVPLLVWTMVGKTIDAFFFFLLFMKQIASRL